MVTTKFLAAMAATGGQSPASGIMAQHLIVLGKTGSGKSSTLRLLVEESFDTVPVCIVDPKGDWWGLKSSADGRNAGLPVVIFGGEHADVPINARAGAMVAELFATGNRPCIIDLGGWTVGDRTRFFIDFAAALFRLSRGPRRLVIDEVHNFAPQGKVLDPDAGKMLHWANRLASEGRGKGITILAASQRPQKVHKDFLTSCETLIAMRVIHPLDRKAIKDWIDGCPDPDKGREVLASLASMPRGEGWVWSPEIGFGPQRLAFDRFRTFDSFKAPTGEILAKLKGWAHVDLEEVKVRMADVLKEAEANDPRQLRARIAELERELAAEHKRDRGADGALAQVERLKSILANASAHLTGLAVRAGEIENIARRDAAELAEAAMSKAGSPGALPGAGHPARAKASTAAPPAFPAPHAGGAGRAARPAPAAASAGGCQDLPSGERTVLIAIAQHDTGCTREQISILTGYKRSTRDAYLQRLREKQFIDQSGDRICATDAGFGALGDSFEPLPKGSALREYWFAKLPAGESQILQLLCEVYPEYHTRDAIAAQTGFARSTRDAYLQRLAARQLIYSSREGVMAKKTLFD